MIRYLLLVSLIFATAAASAQAHMDEVVYLKNGTSVRGLIIEWIPGTSISIRDKSGEMHTYTMAEVDRIRRETGTPPPPPPLYAAIEVGLTDFPTPHRHDAHLNFPYASFNVVGGARLSQVFSAGLGFGAEVYSARLYYLSGYAHMRILMTKKKIAPYLELNAGYTGLVYYFYEGYYNSILYRAHTGGALVNPSLGVKFSVAKKVALTLSAGYKLVVFPGGNYESQVFYSDKNNIMGHAVTIRAGVAF